MKPLVAYRCTVSDGEIVTALVGEDGEPIAVSFLHVAEDGTKAERYRLVRLDGEIILDDIVKIEPRFAP